jgi:predicted CxxxxCH...CXXCH cytochrome family protein
VRRLGLVLLPLVVSACTSARPVEGRRAPAQTWTTIGPRLASACGACHGDAAAGGYRVSSYLDAIGATSGVRMAIAGDARSRLLAILDPAAAISPHDGQADLYSVLRTWVIDDALAYASSEVHAGGLLDPLSSDFHGQLVVARGWDLALCQRCHGVDFAGGPARASCNGCHAQSPASCTTCHGAPPATGAHLAHAHGSSLGRALDCGECHLKPSRWDDPGHLRDAQGALLPPPAVVRFGALAATTTPTRAAAPSWQDGVCANTYCHGGAFTDSAATGVAPSWNAGPLAAACGTCHGLPPAGHPGGACSSCHAAVVDDAMHIIAPSAHVVGRVSLGIDGSGSCTSCHPNPGGAHAAHTGAAHRLSAPIECSECHVVPSAVDSAGHLSASGDAAVFPPGGVGSRAGAFGAIPEYEAASGRCRNVACHGGGTTLAADQALGIDRTPSWNGGTSESCGSCHGVPPADGVHDRNWGLTTCASCHDATMDASGALIVSATASAHINGVVDVR